MHTHAGLYTCAHMLICKLLVNTRTKRTILFYENDPIVFVFIYLRHFPNSNHGYNLSCKPNTINSCSAVIKVLQNMIKSDSSFNLILLFDPLIIHPHQIICKFCELQRYGIVYTPIRFLSGLIKASRGGGLNANFYTSC